MSFKIFLRDINVSNARNALYTLGSPRFPADSAPIGSISRQFGCGCGQSKSETRLGTNFELAAHPIISTQQVAAVSSILSTATVTSAPAAAAAIATTADKNLEEASLSCSEEFFIENEKIQNAGNKIFMATMLHSWRKQRHLIKQLSQQLEDFKRQTMKHDHRVHVYEKMYDTEKERNFELKTKLRESRDQLGSLRTKYDSVADSNATLKASISLLEQQLAVREEQYEGLQVAFNEMQTTLFRSMAKERELHRQLSDEQRRVQSFMVRENDLVEKIQEFKKFAEFKEQNLCDQISFKRLSLMRYKQDNDVLHTSVNALLMKKQEINNIDSRLFNTMNEIIEIKNDVLSLRDQLQNSWDNRMKRLWRTTTSLRLRIADIVFAIAFCVLPCMPLPRAITFALLPMRWGFA